MVVRAFVCVLFVLGVSEWGWERAVERVGVCRVLGALLAGLVPLFLVTIRILTSGLLFDIASRIRTGQNNSLGQSQNSWEPKSAIQASHFGLSSSFSQWTTSRIGSKFQGKNKMWVTMSKPAGKCSSEAKH
jgi:hypothetical protein